MVPRGFQQVHRSFHIDPLIQCRLLEARPDPGPRSQVDDLVKIPTGEHGFDLRGVGQIGLDQPNLTTTLTGLLKIPQLDVLRIKVVQVIQNRHHMSAPQQALTYVRPDESRPTCHQKMHRRRLSMMFQPANHFHSQSICRLSQRPN